MSQRFLNFDVWKIRFFSRANKNFSGRILKIFLGSIFFFSGKKINTGCMRFPHSFKSGFSRLASGFSRHFASLVRSKRGLHTSLRCVAAYRGTRFARGFEKELCLAASRLIGALRFARGFKKELRLAASRLIGALRFARGFKKELHRGTLLRSWCQKKCLLPIQI